MNDSPRHDPIRDNRPPARKLFNPEFVTIAGSEADIVFDNSIIKPASEVQSAWRACQWHSIPMLNMVGEKIRVADAEDFDMVLPDLGTNRVRYSTEGNWVCREFALAFAAIVAAELAVNVGVVCDFGGEHMYNFVPLTYERNTVRIAIVEPQADRFVLNLDPVHHYDGEKGLAFLV